jgi:hypothetical protein
VSIPKALSEHFKYFILYVQLCFVSEGQTHKICLLVHFLHMSRA